MTESLHVRVTQQHIESGKAVDPAKCPVALACKAAKPEWLWLVTSNWIEAFDDSQEHINPLHVVYVKSPESARRFVTAFDWAETQRRVGKAPEITLAPFEFDIPLVDELSPKKEVKS